MKNEAGFPREFVRRRPADFLSSLCSAISQLHRVLRRFSKSTTEPGDRGMLAIPLTLIPLTRRSGQTSECFGLSVRRSPLVAAPPRHAPALKKTCSIRVSSAAKNQPPSEVGSPTSPLLKSTYSSVKSAAYITAFARPRFRLMCSSNSFGATAAHNSLNVAGVGWPRLRLQRIFFPPTAE